MKAKQLTTRTQASMEKSRVGDSATMARLAEMQPGLCLERKGPRLGEGEKKRMRMQMESCW